MSNLLNNPPKKMQLKKFDDMNHFGDSLHSNNEDDVYSLSSENSAVIVRSYDNQVVGNNDEKLILPVESSDSMPSCFNTKEETNGIVLMSNQATQTDTECLLEESSMKCQQQHLRECIQRHIIMCMEFIQIKLRESLASFNASDSKNSILKKLKSMHEKVLQSKVLFLWVVTIMLVCYLSVISIKQSQEISQLKLDLACLKKTLSDLEVSKVKEGRGWFDRVNQSSKNFRDWASTLIDIDVPDSINNESTYLDIWPQETLKTFKDVTSSMTKLFRDKVGEVGIATKEAISTVQGNMASVGENIVAMTPVTLRNQTLSSIMKNVWNAQQYQILFEVLQAALLFKICYEKFIDNE